MIVIWSIVSFDGHSCTLHMITALRKGYTKEKFRCFWEESERAGSHWELNPGHLACAASALSLSCDDWTTTSQSSICTAQQVGLKWLSHTPDSLSACAVRASFTGGWLVKFSQSREKPCWVFFSVQMLRTLALCRILEVKVEESEKVMLSFSLSASKT